MWFADPQMYCFSYKCKNIIRIKLFQHLETENIEILTTHYKPMYQKLRKHVFSQQRAAWNSTPVVWTLCSGHLVPKQASSLVSFPLYGSGLPLVPLMTLGERQHLLFIMTCIFKKQ